MSRSHHRLDDQSSNPVTSLKSIVVMTIVRRVKDRPDIISQVSIDSEVFESFINSVILK